MAKIKVDPALLTSQSQEMTALAGEYESLFNGVISTLNGMNDSWSEVLSNNFSGKIITAQKSFSQVTELLNQGALAAQTAATTFEDVDTTLAWAMNGVAIPIPPIGTWGDNITSTDGDNSNNGSIWERLKEQLKDNWDKAGNVFKYLEKLYNKLPEKARQGIEQLINAVLGPSGSAAIQITGDILTGEASWDTLQTALTSMGMENTTISVIMNSFKYAVNNEHGQGLSAVAYGVADVATEVAADVIQGTVGRITDGVAGVANIVGEGLNAIGCETIGNVISSVGEAVSGAADTVVGWIRGWF